MLFHDLSNKHVEQLQGALCHWRQQQLVRTGGPPGSCCHPYPFQEYNTRAGYEGDLTDESEKQLVYGG